MEYTQPITDLIRQRASTRTYQKRALEGETREALERYLQGLQTGPLGNPSRFELIDSSQGDGKDLQGLGTYGFIKDAAGFIIGTLQEGEKDLEDFGYQMERAILFATSLGLGSCWLGGTFTKSRFARKIALKAGETIPAVTAVGYTAAKARRLDHEIRQRARADRRLPWEKLFFDTRLGAPLGKTEAGSFAAVLEMVRLGPSASNRQPWRVVKGDGAWHLYLQRTPGYPDGATAWLLKLADLQRIDMGIAMCHFELAARQAGLPGGWQIQDPGLEVPDEWTEYTVSWVEV